MLILRIFDMKCQINLLIHSKFDEVENMKKNFKTSKFFEQEFKILCNILMTFMIYEIHRHLLENHMMNILKQFTDLSNQDNSEELFLDLIDMTTNKNYPTLFNEDMFVKLEQVEDLETYNEFLEYLKTLFDEMEFFKDTSPENSKKNNSLKNNKKKKLESSFLQDSTENNYIKEMRTTLTNHLNRRIAYLFDLFRNKGKEMIDLKNHQIELVEDINHSVINAEKTTVYMLTMFLGI